MRHVAYILSFILLILVNGCTADGDTNAADSSSAVREPTQEELTQHAVFIWEKCMDKYEIWQVRPKLQEVFDVANSPHGLFYTVYANSMAVKTADLDSGEMPVGAMFVRNNYDENAQLLNITAMRKEEGGWFWVYYNPDGTVKLAGKIDSCIHCHSSAQRDLVFNW